MTMSPERLGSRCARIAGWTVVLCAGAALVTVPAEAQCPDGAPPPCRRPVAAPAPAASAPTSVAVLYFDNASADADDAYLADGITEEIISRLGGVSRLQVKSRYLVRRYRGARVEDPPAIGRQLAVASIVTGSVRRAGNRLRVTAELVRAATGDVMWSERYDRADTDVLSLQEDLAGAVATAIAGRLLPDERQALAARPTRNREAWDHLIRGNFYLAQRTPGAHGRALDQFQEAARLDPGFTQALARVAFTYGVASWRSEPVNGLAPDSSLRLARAAADRAIRANPRSSDAWMARGLAQAQRPESVAVARASLERAIELDSANAEAWHVLGWVYFYARHDADAVAAWHRALAIEPGRPITLAVLGWYAVLMQRWDDAERWTDSALGMDAGFGQALFVRGMARLARGDTAGARSDLALRSALRGSTADEAVLLGMIAVRAGDSTGLRVAIARLEEAPDRLDDYSITVAGLALVELGAVDRALDWLARIRWRNTNFYTNLLIWPFDRLAGQARYEGLLDEWRIPAGVRR